MAADDARRVREGLRGSQRVSPRTNREATDDVMVGSLACTRVEPAPPFMHRGASSFASCKRGRTRTRRRLCRVICTPQRRKEQDREAYLTHLAPWALGDQHFPCSTPGGWSEVATASLFRVAPWLALTPAKNHKHKARPSCLIPKFPRGRSPKTRKHPGINSISALDL